MRLWAVLPPLLLSLNVIAAEPDFPIPPIPPPNPPPESAPIPDRDVFVPGGGEEKPRVTLDMETRHRGDVDPGASPSPGAHYDFLQDHKAPPITRGIPGVLFRVPFP